MKSNPEFNKRLARMLFTVLFPISVLVSILFYYANASLLKKSEAQLVSYAEQIDRNIDNVIDDVYNISDAFANDVLLNSYFTKTYIQEEASKKLVDIAKINTTIFSSVNWTRQTQRINAVYTSKGVLFNFTAPQNDREENIKKLLALGIESPGNLSKIVWSPLIENFLSLEDSDNSRNRNILLGSRRIFKNGTYPFIHIFCVEEQRIYDQYEFALDQIKGDVFILQKDGTLISSSEGAVVESGEVPGDIVEKVLSAQYENQEFIEKDRDLIFLLKNKQTEWTIVVRTDKQSNNREINAFYTQAIFLIFLSAGISAAMIVHTYKTFTNPLGKLSEAMKRVNAGDMNAYVTPVPGNQVGKMMAHYNAMLQSVNRNFEEKLFFEEAKKQLELQVLTNQINPHFLYNTLETIIWKAREVGKDDIAHIASSLGKLYRATIQGDTLIPISQELEHVKAYVEIQKSRYVGKFGFQIIDPRNLADKFLTLRLVLQPVVENIILYGMEDVSHVVSIRLVLKEKEKYIQMKILDNGCGIEKERLEKIRSKLAGCLVQGEDDTAFKGNGIGLTNINDRLKLFLNVAQGIEMSSKFGFGTKVIIKLPKVENAGGSKDAYPQVTGR